MSKKIAFYREKYVKQIQKNNWYHNDDQWINNIWQEITFPVKLLLTITLFFLNIIDYIHDNLHWMYFCTVTLELDRPLR